MPSYKHLKGVAAGLAGTFMSRNNDIDGYWAMGIIYAEVAATGFSEVTFNLLNADVSPRIKCASLLLDRYRETVDRMFQRLGFSSCDVASVDIQIRFGSNANTEAVRATADFGNPFSCRVTITDVNSREWSVTAGSWCHSHGSRCYIRSGRRLEYPYFTDGNGEESC